MNESVTKVLKRKKSFLLKGNESGGKRGKKRKAGVNKGKRFTE